MFVRERDHRRVLWLLEAAAATESRAELVAQVMPPLHVLFHADEVSYTEVVIGAGRVRSSAGYPTAGTAQPAALRAYQSRPLEHPWVAHIARGGPAGSVRLSDLCSRGDLRRSVFYQDFFRPRGVEFADYQSVSIAGGRAVGFSVARRDRDFTGDEHDLFDHVRRPLSHIWHLVSRLESLDVARAGRGYGRGTQLLTPAERRVSALVLQGRRNRAIAQELGVSTKAVEQHLTRIYRKEAVNSRAEYLARAIAAEPGDD